MHGFSLGQEVTNHLSIQQQNVMRVGAKLTETNGSYQGTLILKQPFNNVARNAKSKIVELFG